MKKIILLSLIGFTSHLYSAAQNPDTLYVDDAEKMTMAEIKQFLQQAPSTQLAPQDDEIDDLFINTEEPQGI